MFRSDAIHLDICLEVMDEDHLSFLEFGLKEWEKKAPTETEV